MWRLCVALVLAVVVRASQVAQTTVQAQDQVAVKSVMRRDVEWESLTVDPSDKSSATFFLLDFDASAFEPSAAPYGQADPQSRWECPFNKLSQIAPTSRALFPPNKDLLLRRIIDLPAGVTSLEVKLTVHRSVAVYLNGQAVSGDTKTAQVTPGGLCAALDNVQFSIPDRFVRTGTNLLAIRVFGAEELNYFDGQVRAFFPRPTGDVGVTYTWGKGYFGVLGNGFETDNFAPSRILDLKELKTEPIKQVALGVSHTVMLTGSGKVYAWGRGKEGQLGLGEEYSETPLASVDVNNLGKITAVAAGSLHTLFLDAEGKVFCVGANADYQCGLGEDDKERTITEPVRVSELDDQTIALISAKDSHSVAVSVDGKVFVWGRGVDKAPRYVGDVAGVKQIAAGTHHVLFLDGNKNVLAFGQGEQGQLGLPSGAQRAAVPTIIDALKGLSVARVFAGSDNSFAVTESGRVYVWGGGSFGKNGLGVWGKQRVPVQVMFSADSTAQPVIKSIGAGMTSTLFLTNKGEVYYSGSSLRDGSHVMTPTFWASASDKFFTDVFASHLHFAAVTDPSKWTWKAKDNFFEGTMA